MPPFPRHCAGLSRPGAEGLQGGSRRKPPMTDAPPEVPPDALPTFLCLGSQRCASTWLQRVLERHPDVGMCRKEPDYWSREFRRRPLDWYADLFREADAVGKPARGDVSPSYAAMSPAEVAVVSGGG